MEIKNRIEDALERVGLFEKSNYHISQFSGGDRQRTKFDRAVCQTQKLLLLDEPTNHHDQAAKGPLLNAAMQLGIKVVTALHDLTLIDDFATHVVDLKKWSLATSAEFPPNWEFTTDENGNITGGNFNPAVSVMMVAAGKLPSADLLPYVLAQVTGGLAALELYKRVRL